MGRSQPRRQHGPKRAPRQAPSQPPRQAPASAEPALADRYYAMAEEMNSRGAMELAVPFYRQAMALLLAERNQLRAQLPQASGKGAQALPLDQLHGLLEAAQHWEQQQDEPPRQQEPEPPADLEPSIAELADDLSAASAQQVLAALTELEQQHGDLPASGYGLRGKAWMLAGDAQAALAAFESACQAEPGRIDLQVNRGAALLASGHTEAALEALRLVYQQHYEHLEGEAKIALLRNLATAEARGGELAVALHLRRQWLQLDPTGQPSERWLQWARQGLAIDQPEAAHQAAVQLLQRLHEHRPGERPVMEALAEALEGAGQFREASLLYRSLLRPSDP